jgi:hypothetical protein
MNLREKEDKLFQEWSKNKTGFAKDGAGKHFENQKTKFIFVGKETNDTNNGFDWREYLDEGVFYKSTNKPFKNTYNLYRWAKFLLEGEMSFGEYKKVVKNRNKRKDLFGRVAFMNIKKSTGGSSSNCNEIIHAGREDKDLIKQQIELYTDNGELKILFLLGNCIYTPVKEILGKAKDKYYINNSRFIEIYDNNLFVVRFYHFQGCSVQKGYQLIKKVYGFIANSMNESLIES